MQCVPYVFNFMHAITAVKCMELQNNQGEKNPLTLLLCVQKNVYILKVSVKSKLLNEIY